ADGARIVSGDWRGDLLIWDSRSGEQLLAIQAGKEIKSCAFSADGARIVSGGYEGNLLVWDSRSGKHLLAIKAGREIRSCAFSADGARIVSGDQQGNLLVWDSQSGEKLLAMKADVGISSAALRRGNPYVISVDCAFSADGARIVSGDSRGNFLVWDSQSGERLWQLSYTGASHLCWQPPTGKILSASGLFWRDFYWDVTLADGGKERLPIEVFYR
ncbi:MAG TPA: hypothetical protein DEB25_05545, partial [Desulfobulbaceae bacterium]|nr:hypothetical protein [Desulfobulbaceae bacterium]